MILKSYIVSTLLSAIVFFAPADGKCSTSIVTNPTVTLNEKNSQLCYEADQNGLICSNLSVPVGLNPIKSIIQIDSWDGAPYVWIALGGKHAAVCAAGKNSSSDNMCINLKVDISSVLIKKSIDDRLGFSFIAKNSRISNQKLQRKASRFSNSYAKAIEILHAYAQSNWTLDSSSSISSKIAARSVTATNKIIDSSVVVVKPAFPLDDCGIDDNPASVSVPAVTSYECDDDPGEDDGGAGGGGGGGDAGGGDSGGSSGGGYEEPNPDPQDIDPDTGLPVPRVIIYPPVPKWPADPNWCSLVGLFCSSSSSTPDNQPSKVFCDAKLQEAYVSCNNVYVADPNKLPGTGSDMPSRYRLCIRNYLADFDCHNY